MPSIIIDVTSTMTPLIDAQLCVSFSRLTDILKIIVENSNRHESEIESLKKQLQNQKEKTEELEALLRSSSDEAIRADILDELRKMRAQIVALQKQQEATTSRVHENFETTHKMMHDEASSTSRAFASAAERAAQVQNQVNTLRSTLEPRVEQCWDFLQLWGLPDVKLMGVLANQLRDSSAAGVCGPSAESQDAGAEFIRSLKPFAKSKDLVTTTTTTTTTAPTNVPAIDPRALQNIENELRRLTAQMLAVEAKICPLESVPPRVKGLEDMMKLLDATKADNTALQTKADAAKTAQIAHRTNQLGDELAALLARMAACEEANSIGPAPRGTAKIPHPPAVDESLRKRVTDLEGAVEGLEDCKADKSDIARILATLQGITAGPVVPVGDTIADASPKRIGSAGSKRSVFLGRTVAVVRDANGTMTPASLAARM